MYQKSQISLPMGYKTARPKKQETGNDCDVLSGLQASRKTDFSVIFLSWANQCANKWYNSALFIRKYENVGEICFSRSLESWNDITIVPSLLFLVSRFCNPPKWNLTRWVHQNTGKENRYRKIFLLYLSVHWGDLIEKIRKKSVIYTLKNEFAFSDRSFTCLAGARWQDLMSHVDFLFIFGQCGDNCT